MMEDWEVKEIDNVCEDIVDCLNRTAPKVEFVTPYKMIRTSNVRHGRIDLENVFYADEPTYKKWTRRLVPKKGDIILTREAPLGEVGILKTDDKVFLGQRTVMYRANPKVCDNRFLYYSLLAPFCQANIKAYASGSTVEHMKVPDSKKIKLKLPPLPTQRKIASILSAYDDLIENNLNRIKLLEEKAQLIYEEWFVRMKFPGHETTPINKESGLPEGWKEVKLTDYIELLRGIEPGSKNYKESMNDGLIPFIRVGDLSKRSPNIFVSKDIIKNKIAKRTDVLLSLDGSPGLVVYGLEGAYSTGVRKAISKNISIKNSFIFALLSSDKIQGLIRNHATGSTILHAGGSVKYMRFDLPTKNVLNKFNDISEDIFSSILNLNEQNQLLKEARDILLPRLMTGMIDVEQMNLENLHSTTT